MSPVHSHRRPGSRLLGIAIASLLLVGSGCKNVPPEERRPSPAWLSGSGTVDPNDVGPVWIVGTPTYSRKVATFAISPGEAERLARQRIAKNPEAHDSLGTHYVICKDCYVFTIGWDKMDLTLCGYFVNGHSGEVHFNKVPYRLAYRDYPELREAINADIERRRSKEQPSSAGVNAGTTSGE